MWAYKRIVSCFRAGVSYTWLICSILTASLMSEMPSAKASAILAWFADALNSVSLLTHVGEGGRRALINKVIDPDISDVYSDSVGSNFSTVAWLFKPLHILRTHALARPIRVSVLREFDSLCTLDMAISTSDQVLGSIEDLRWLGKCSWKSLIERRSSSCAFWKKMRSSSLSIR